MRKIGHKVDEKSLRSALQDYQEELSQAPAMRKEQIKSQNPGFFTGNAEIACAVARIEYLFAKPVDELKKLLGTFIREVPTAVDMDGLIEPKPLTEFLGSALLIGDEKLAAWFAGLKPAVYVDPEGEGSQGIIHYVQAYQAAALGDPKGLKSAVKKFRSVLVPAKLLEPRVELAMYNPLADLLEAIADRDQKRFDDAWKAQGDAWKKRFGRASEQANYDGLLDLEALGLAVIARRAGLQVPDTNPYAPLEILDAGSKK